jgi:hypothetical protein
MATKQFNVHGDNDDSKWGKTQIKVVGRGIIRQGGDWIQLDDGKKLYLDPSELDG